MVFPRRFEMVCLMSRVLCVVCGDVIGVYEPLIVVGSGPMRSSSLAREPGLRSRSGELAHFGCGAGLDGAGADSASLDTRASEID